MARLFPQPGGRRVFGFEENMDRHLASADSKPVRTSVAESPAVFVADHLSQQL
jgi:hypothetical protein